MGQPAVAVFDLWNEEALSQKPIDTVWENAQANSNGSHVAFRMATSITAEDLLASAATDAEVTVIVEDAARATGGRASADLAAVIWQSFPSIAAFLSERVSSAGAVVFSAAAFQQAQQLLRSSPDPVTAAVLAIISSGGRIRAVLMPGDSNSAPPSAPPQLAPNRPRAGSGWQSTLIANVDVAGSLGVIASQPDATAVRAGLLLWHDFLDESHDQSQSIEGEGRNAAGDYWHAIMHRRERDYGNSKYWFRRVGGSPIFEPLASRVVRNSREAGSEVEQTAARIAADGRWDPIAFVDACEAAETSSDDAMGLFLRRIQADEMLLLLWQTCLDAKGEP